MEDDRFERKAEGCVVHGRMNVLEPKGDRKGDEESAIIGRKNPFGATFEEAGGSTTELS